MGILFDGPGSPGGYPEPGSRSASPDSDARGLARRIARVLRAGYDGETTPLPYNGTLAGWWTWRNPGLPATYADLAGAIAHRSPTARQPFLAATERAERRRGMVDVLQGCALASGLLGLLAFRGAVSMGHHARTPADTQVFTQWLYATGAGLAVAGLCLLAAFGLRVVLKRGLVKAIASALAA